MVTDISGVARPIAKANGLPNAHYTDPTVFAEERDALLYEQWSGLAVAADVPEPGDAKPIEFLGAPLLLLRDKTGTVRVFHNICRHRGTELLEDCGNAGKTIMCPYHNWVYNLDGRLRGVPAQSACFPDMDKSQIRLHGAAVGVFRDLVFVHPEEDPEVLK